MAKKNAIDWKEIEDELKGAPDKFLQAASSLLREKQKNKRARQSKQSDVINPADSYRKDTEQQRLWKAANDAATEKLLFFGEIKDKGDRIRLLQSVNVVKRTAKQIHIVATYTLYHTKIKINGVPVAWSTSPTGGVFSDMYTEWVPVKRYRLRRISKVNLCSPDVLNIPKDGESAEERSAYAQAWYHLCRVCLFANEDEYAWWHLARYESERESEEDLRAGISDFSITKPDPCKILDIPQDASQADIKKAYKRMAMKHHPDRGGTTTKFQNVIAAYEMLRHGNSHN